MSSDMQAAKNNDLLFAIQDHVNGETVYSKKVVLTGWCFPINGIDLDGIRAQVGKAVFVARRNQTRWNVAAMYPNELKAINSGFTVEIELARGASDILFEAKLEGKWIPFATLQLRRPWIPFPRQQSKKPLDYSNWVKLFDEWTPRQLDELARDIADNFKSGPLISILLPAYNTPKQLLKECLDSILAQIYPHWELCVADDASTTPHVSALLEEYQKKDPRIKIHQREKNGHICAASNSALALVTGKYTALLDHDDLLAPHALYWVAREIRSHPESVLIYSDEDKLDALGKRTDPYFKSDWDPELLLGQNYLNHLTVYRTDSIREVGAFREGLEGAQDWDLALRVTERCTATQIRHIPKVLYHWRITEGSTATRHTEKPYAANAGVKAVAEALERRHQSGHKIELLPSHHLRIIRPLPSPSPRVAVIVPTRNRLDLIQRCVESLYAHTDYPNWKLIVVDHESTDPGTVAFLKNLVAEKKAEVRRETGPFNFSRLNNHAVQSASWADVVVLLNNDTYVHDTKWLHELVSQAVRSDVGAVGARLLYPNGLFQHAGVFLGYLGAAGHLARGTDGTSGANNAWTKLTRRVSAVTAACMAVERRKYMAVNGMDETVFGVAYNDVDFCLRLSAAGFQTLYTPFATVIHDESVTRGADEKTPAGKARANQEIALLQERWGGIIHRDPLYNPNLTLHAENMAPNFNLPGTSF